MAYNEVIEGILNVGTLSAGAVSSLSVGGTVTVSGTQNFTGTASFTTASAVFNNSTSLVLTAGNVSSAIVSACTQNSRAGKITTTALTAAAASVWSLVVTNSVVSTTDQIFVTITNGSNTGDGPHLGAKLQSSGAMTIQCRTLSALNGTLIFDYVIFK